MTKQEAWVRFMAGAVTACDSATASKIADRALAHMLQRWPETPGMSPKPLEDERAGKGALAEALAKLAQMPPDGEPPAAP